MPAVVGILVDLDALDVEPNGFCRIRLAMNGKKTMAELVKKHLSGWRADKQAAVLFSS